MATHPQFTDRELFRLISTGDESAFTTLFHKYKASLFDFAMKVTKSSTSTEELVQDSFLKLWASRHHLATVEDPAAYIHSIIKNNAIDHFRRLALDRNLQRRTLAATSPGVNTTAETLEHSETRRLIDEAVNQLPDQQRQVFSLSRYEGLSYIEIAEKLGISANTVRNHLVKALSTIRNWLAEHYGGPVVLIIMAFLDRRGRG